MIAFRDRRRASSASTDRHTNPDGVRAGINPFTHGSTVHTDVMKTEALKQALDKYGFDAAFGGARRDEEKSRAKERIFSFRNAQHRWDPKNQRPELWNLYNTRIHKGESDPRVPAVELDRARRLAIHPPARTSRSCRSTSPRSARWSSATAR
jgi:sulfate adenylyltransferase subunit 2